MQAWINWDLPTCTSPNKLVGINHPLITLRAPGNKVQASNGTTTTSTSTCNNTMKKFQVATREDVCLSLPVATMTNRWIIPASTPCWPTLKKHNRTFATPCTSTLSGKQTWETPSSTFSRTSSKRMRTGPTRSRISTSTRHCERMHQHEEEDSPFI